MPGRAEVNAGTYCFDASWLWAHIDAVPRSSSGEHYLTHLPSMAAAEGTPAQTVNCPPDDFLGVDDRPRP